MARSAALQVYLAATARAGPLARVLLERRAERGREDRARLGERFGRPGRPRPDGQLIWLHGASMGESLSMLPLIGALRRAAPGIGILVTTGTLTSARMIGPELPEAAVHQFVPVDTAEAVERFLDHWRPDLGIWIESEFWPRLMVATAERGVPMMLINARMSESSARHWRLIPGMARALVRLFDRVLTQDSETAARLIALGADPERVSEAGNLKVALPPPGADPVALVAMRDAIGARPVWLAASTHAPEEEAVAEAHVRAAAALPGLLTLLAPRHPERAEAIAGMLRARDLSVARRAAGEQPTPAAAVYLADTLGEMGLWYRLAPVSFVGGSLAPIGGHNPFEPVALGSGVIYGPDTRNFAPAYRALAEQRGAREVADGRALGEAVAALLGPGGTAALAAMTDAAEAARVGLMPDVDRMASEVLALAERRG